MDIFETDIKKLINNLKRYSIIEFFHEETALNKQINLLGEDLDAFNIYLPKNMV